MKARVPCRRRSQRGTWPCDPFPGARAPGAGSHRGEAWWAKRPRQASPVNSARLLRIQVAVAFVMLPTYNMRCARARASVSGRVSESGLRSTTGNRVGGESRLEGSNPSPSARKPHPDTGRPGRTLARLGNRGRVAKAASRASIPPLPPGNHIQIPVGREGPSPDWAIEVGWRKPPRGQASLPFRQEITGFRILIPLGC